MPNVNEYQDESEWMKVCVPAKIEEGQEQDQAVAVCMSIWREKGNVKSVKAVGEWELEVLGVPFGSPQDRDSDGEYFTPDTAIHQDKYPAIPAVYYHGRNPDGKQSPTPEYIGVAKYDRTDEKGHWYRVVLDKTKQFAKRVWEAAKDGIARASSGSAPHLVRYGGDGKINEWAVVELSVFDAVGQRQPSNKHAIALPVMKAIYEEAKLPYDIQPEALESAAVNNQNSKMENTKMNEKEVKGLTPEDVKAQIDAALKAQRNADEEAQKAAKARQEEIDAEVKKQVEAIKAEAAKSRRLPDYDGVAPYATKFNDTKFDSLTAGDLSLGIEIMRANGRRVSEGAVKSLAYKLLEESPKDEQHEKDALYIKSALKAAGLGDENAVKAAEVMATSDSGNGSDWIGTAYSTELWRSIRHAGGIVEKIPSVVIPDGYSSQYFPLEDADPTWYKVAETTAEDSTMKVPVASIPSSKAGTGTRQLTVAKGGARVLYSGELTEDSIVAFAPQLREQLMVSGREMMENVVINGDTEAGATTNINDIAGTPAGTEAFMILNGFRKLALVTNTANSRSASGALSLEDYLETLRLMGTAGIAASDLSKVMFIVDPHVHYANMTLPEVKTRDVYSAATIENGFLKRAYGVEIMPSWQFAKGATGAYALKANTAGKVDLDTNTNNTTGSILAVRPDQWKLGYKRRMTIELTRFANSDSWEIVALARFGLAYRDTEAAAISYNVGV